MTEKSCVLVPLGIVDQFTPEFVLLTIVPMCPQATTVLLIFVIEKSDEGAVVLYVHVKPALVDEYTSPYPSQIYPSV